MSASSFGPEGDDWINELKFVRRVLTERRYVTPDEAAMERACNLTARQWQAAGVTTGNAEPKLAEVDLTNSGG